MGEGGRAEHRMHETLKEKVTSTVEHRSEMTPLHAREFTQHRFGKFGNCAT